MTFFDKGTNFWAFFDYSYYCIVLTILMLHPSHKDMSGLDFTLLCAVDLEIFVAKFCRKIFRVNLFVVLEVPTKFFL